MQIKEMTYKEALRLALSEELSADENVVVLGEDVVATGGACGVTLGLAETFGKDRVINMPASEQAMVGTAVGAALTGLRPVVELRSMDQATLALGQIVAGARTHYQSGGSLTVPMVVLIPTGFGTGNTQDSQTLEGMAAQIPGLKVVEPTTPAQAKGLLKAAVRDDNPVLFLMNRDLMGLKSQAPVDDTYILPLEQSYVEHTGRDVTIVSWGASLVASLEAAQKLLAEDIDVEVINPMTLYPFDISAVGESVQKTGRLLIVSEGLKTGVAAEISASIAESDYFDYLEAPISRLCGLETPLPYNKELQAVTVPQVGDVVQAVYDLLDK